MYPCELIPNCKRALVLSCKRTEKWGHIHSSDRCISGHDTVTIKIIMAVVLMIPVVIILKIKTSQ